MVEHILINLMSPNNELRRETENQFKSLLESDLNNVLRSLFAIFSNQAIDLVLRSLTGILIRSSIEKYSENFTQQMQIELQRKLLSTWYQESNKLIFKRLSHIMAQLSLNSQWVELIPTLIQYCQNKAPAHTAPALYLIEIIPDYSPENIQKNLNCIGSLLGQHITSPCYELQISCARATCSCIICLDVLGNCLVAGNEVDASLIMDQLINIANVQPIFFKGTIDNTISAMLRIVSTTSFEVSTRALAIELIVTLCETAPALARRCECLIPGIIPLLFGIMIDRDEKETQWSLEKYSDESIDGDYTVGEESVERLASGLGGRMVAPEVLKYVETYSGHQQWNYRVAAVVAVSRLMEGCPQYFEKNYLVLVKQFCSKMLQDPSPIVKYEVIQAIGRMATNFQSESENLVALYVSPLVMLLSDSNQCERVRGHTIAALINLTNPESCEASTLKPYLDLLLNALITTLQTASLNIQPSCLILIGGIAKVMEEGFATYYGAIMPGIKMLLTHALAPDLTLLRGRAMECVGLLGEAVGAQVFANDALEVMNLLIGAIELDKDNDMTFDYILPACARISKALEHRFEPFLPLVMGPLLVGANQTIQFCMEDAGEDDLEGEVTRNEDTGFESTVISLGAGLKKKVTLNTLAIQQKQQAARMLFEFASSMKGQLKAYIIPSVQALLSMITDKHSGDVRSSASLALSKMFEAYLLAVKGQLIQGQSLPELLSACLGKLLEALKCESSCTARACAAESLKDILLSCYNSGAEGTDGTFNQPICIPSLEISTAIAQELLKLCGESIQRKQLKVSEFQSNEGLEDEDREAFAEDLEEEEDTMMNLVDAIGQLLKLHGEDFMPFFDNAVSAAFAPYLMPSQPESLQILAVCMVDDAIEFGGKSAHKYCNQMMPIFLHNIESTNNVLRQCSTYGIAQSLRFAPNMCLQHVKSTVAALIDLVNQPDSRSEENEGATENAIYALGMIYHIKLYRTVSWGPIEPYQLASLWLQSLPLRADVQEAKVAHNQLCDALESGDAIVYGENYTNISQIFRIIADIFLDTINSSTKQSIEDVSMDKIDTSMLLSGISGSLAHSSTIARMQTILRQIISTGGLNNEFLVRSMQNLSSIQQRVIQCVL